MAETNDQTSHRVQALRETGLLDTPPEAAYDRITAIAARLLRAPMALVSLVDSERQFFKSAVGLPEPLASARETPLAYSYCKHAVETGDPLVVNDARDHPLLRENLATTEMGVRSYAGVPLFAVDGAAIGTLCVLGPEPRTWTEEEVELLRGLAAGVQSEIRLRHEVARLEAAEARLRESQAELRQIVDVVPHLLFVKDEEGRYLVVNQAFAAVFGRTPEEIVGLRDAEIGVEPAEAERYYAEEQEVMRTGMPRATTGLPHRNVDGEHRLYDAYKVSFRRAGTDKPAVLGLVRDVTGEREQAQQLRRAERLATVGTLVGGVAHELNNPLSAITGLSQLMLMDPHPEDDRQALETIQREADRMARIVADLRRLARESHEPDAARVPVDLNEVIRHVLRVRGYSLSTHNIAVVEEMEPDLGPVMADPGRLEQVVLNLVVNAEQAMAEGGQGGTLELRTRSGPRSVSLCVEDTGPGIAPEHQERIFDPFWSTKAPGDGTGLGLSLVHDIVDQLGGSITVESGRTRGACFTVVLPRAAAAAEAASPTPPAPAAAGPAARLRVLVVDDEPSVRTTLVRFLTRRGHQVDEAVEGGAALELLARAREQAGPYDVIISDLRMPGLDGGQLLARLREEGSGMADRLLFLTGDNVSPDAERLLRGSTVPVVLKPFDFARVEEIILRLAAGRSAADVVLRQQGEGIHESDGRIMEAFLARLRTDPGIQETAHLGDADLIDHTCMLVSGIAQALVIPDRAVVDREPMLEDGVEAIQAVSRLHGAQRSRIGWTERSLLREYQILEEEIVSAMRGEGARGAEPAAVATVGHLIECARRAALGALAKAGAG